MNDSQHSVKPNALALIPFVVFAVFYVGMSLVADMHYHADMPFYAVPMPIAFLIASAAALFFGRKKTLTEKIDVYAAGMGETNIMIMCLVFILAGAFATVAKQMGAVDAAVKLCQAVMPPGLMVAGLFVIACLISVSIGTSCGTIAALTPIAVGLIEKMGLDPALAIGSVVGGAMFGDNLSMISDTTIAATRTQNIAMRDKFVANFRIVLPAAILAIVLYSLLGFSGNAADGAVPAAAASPIVLKDFVLVLPYLLVLGLAFTGMNVMLLLFLGTVLAAVVGNVYGAFNFLEGLQLVGQGAMGMSETLIVALLAGGLLGLIRHNGGVAWLIGLIERTIGSVRGCEFGVAALVAAVNLFTANNTVAIVIAGPIAKNLSDRFGCRPARIASILDTTSCVIQGIIPYGAQLLIATSLAKNAGCPVDVFAVIGHLYYVWLLAVAVIVAIVATGRKRTAAPTA